MFLKILTNLFFSLNLDHHINYGHIASHQQHCNNYGNGLYQYSWTCSLCGQQFTTHKRLYYHNRRYHQIGQFRCILPAVNSNSNNNIRCPFVGNCRETIYRHLEQMHYQQTQLHHQQQNRLMTISAVAAATSTSTSNNNHHHQNSYQQHQHSQNNNDNNIPQQNQQQLQRQYQCSIPECGRAFQTKTLLRRHQRFHIRIKPYRCRYPNCGYASEVQYAAITHIRTVHYNLPATLKEQRERQIVDNRDPKDLLDIVTELESEFVQFVNELDCD